MSSHKNNLPGVVHSTVYRYGSPCDQFYGYLALREGGDIYGYDHLNEKRWHLDAKGFAFTSETGFVTSRFQYHPISNCFFGKASGTQWPLCLIPVVSLDTGLNHDSRPPLIINSIPKSGTYFLEAAFAHAGWLPTRLHLGSFQIDDYRNLQDDEIHRTPEKCRINCPVDIFSATLPPAHMAVGHICATDMISCIRKLGIPMINCVRNLRNVIASLYRFKLDKVAPTDASDLSWRRLAEGSIFDGFITVYSSRDLIFVADMARLIIEDTDSIILRYEELILGQGYQKLGRMFADFSVLEKIGDGLVAKLNQPNPTLSNKGTSDWKSVWTPLAEDFFTKSGLFELNRSLGYE